MEQVLGSLELSMLTGPNEGYVMAERGIFGVSLWESLSPDLKSRVAIDLARAEIERDREISDCSFRETDRGAERATRSPPQLPGFRQKRSNNDWDFSFALPKMSDQFHSCRL